MKYRDLLLSLVLLAGCEDQNNPAFPSIPPDEDYALPADEGPNETKEPVDGGNEPEESTDEEEEEEKKDSGLTGQCADEFGDKLTEGFGRIDGIVYAVQKPSDTQCTLPNDDHVIVQVLMDGAVYRLVTNVHSKGADPNVRYLEKKHAMPGPKWSEGWHTGIELDYPTSLDVHNADFTPHPMDDLVRMIAAEVKVGDKISVYAHSGKGRPESAHKIHRNNGSEGDGALVVMPTGALPKFLLFHFDEQVF